MKFNKVTAVFCSAALIISGIYSTANAKVQDKTETVKIMSIGDSITDGYGTEGSYRKFLYNELTEAGYQVDMVGPNCSWGDAQFTYSDGKTFTYDPAHCGYSGYAIEEYPGRNGIRETITAGNYLKEYDPDIVILQIGTNDIIDNHEIDTAGERLDTLVSYILDNISEDDVLFVTTIPELEPNREDVYNWFSNYRHSADWQTQYTDEEAAANVEKQIDNYNTQVGKLVSSKQAEGASNIYFGDVHSAVTDTAAQLKDGVHPNDDGYEAMGKYWSEVILDYFSGALNSHPVTGTTQIPPTPGFDNPTATPSEKPTETPVTEPSAVPSVTPTVIPETFYGDVNSDGTVNASDVVLLQSYLLGEDAEINMIYSDVKNDGVINILDFVMLKNMVLF